MTMATSVVMRDPQKGGQPRVVVLIQGEVFGPLLSWFRGEGMSLPAERGYAYAVARFLNWLAVRGAEFPGIHRQEALAAFEVDLRDGTIWNENGSLTDPTALWWRQTSKLNAKLAVKRVTRFSDWYATMYGTVPLNPERPLASGAEMIRYWAAWARRKNRSLLGHLRTIESDGDRAKWVRQIKEPRDLCGIVDPKKFPEELIFALLTEAWLVNPRATRVHERYNLRDLAITILCLFGGLRISEALHLFADDIPSAPENPDDELLEVHHPTEGWIRHFDERTKQVVRLKRGDYLVRICGRRPLTQETGRRRAGWKNPLLTDKNRRVIQVFWLQPAGMELSAAGIFYSCWAGYLKVRPVVLRTPWAWLTKEGEPMGVLAFEESWGVAMRRIGVKPDKLSGTTPHGLRHRYGEWWNHLKFENEQIDKKMAQIAMHHQSLFSQDIYRQVGPATVAAGLRKLRDELRDELRPKTSNDLNG